MTSRYPDLSMVRKVLVAKLRHHGDVLMASPLFSLLKQRLPGAEIDAYIYKETLPMLDGHPAIDNYLLYDRKWKSLSLLQRYREEIRLLRQIRKNRYDLVINLTEGDRGAIAARCSKASIRIGFDPENSGMRGKNRCYTHIVKNCHRPRHAVERHLDVLRCLGIFPDQEQRDLFLAVPEVARKNVQCLLEGKKGFVIVHPVSRWTFKCLPVKTIASLIARLHAEGVSVILTGSKDSEEMRMNAEIASLCEGIPLVNLSGKTSLKELGALLEICDCLITVDSVPLHMASALKTPVVAIFGPTSEESWAPWNHRASRVITPKVPCRPCYMAGCGGSYRSDCLEKITVDQIMKAFYSLKSSPRYACLAN